MKNDISKSTKNRFWVNVDAESIAIFESVGNKEQLIQRWHLDSLRHNPEMMLHVAFLIKFAYEAPDEFMDTLCPPPINECEERITIVSIDRNSTTEPLVRWLEDNRYPEYDDARHDEDLWGWDSQEPNIDDEEMPKHIQAIWDGVKTHIETNSSENEIPCYIRFI